tara:strand:- start:36008 stop:36283 length:276 start_codon:yes stop_codon:yes gene_type:complete
MKSADCHSVIEHTERLWSSLESLVDRWQPSQRDYGSFGEFASEFLKACKNEARTPLPEMLIPLVHLALEKQYAEFARTDCMSATKNTASLK